MPLRNMHFEAINRTADEVDNEAAKLGTKIALAMVLAVQSEDDGLEGYAYRGLKKFLWLPGEEPQEFWDHEPSDTRALPVRGPPPLPATQIPKRKTL